MDAATPTVTQATVRSRDLPAIDYLRGIAALGVALFHARVAWWVGWREIQAKPQDFSGVERGLAWLSLPAPFLGSFVLLFFVVSGFCVHLPQVASTQSFRFRPYLVRRFFRIYPPYLAAALVSVAVAGTWATRPLGDTMLMVQNYTVGQLSTNPALWSLPVELELYFVYPLLWWGTRRFGWGVVLFAIGVVSAGAAVAWENGVRAVEGNFALYWIIWSAGAWLADKWHRGELRRPPSWFGAVALATCGFAVYATAKQRGGGAVNLAWGLVYFWLVWRGVTANGGSGVRWTWVDAPLRALGRMSYSLYLLHFPLFFLLGAWWVQRFGGKPSNYLAVFVACGAIVPVAWLFYRAVELPSHRLAKRLARRVGATG